MNRQDMTHTEAAMRTVLAVKELARRTRPYREVVEAVRDRLDCSRAAAYRLTAIAADVLGLVLVEAEDVRGRSQNSLRVVVRGAAGGVGSPS